MPTYFRPDFDDYLILLDGYFNIYKPIYKNLLDFEPEEDIAKEDYQYLFERNTQNLENSLGLCFIIAQNFITSVVSDIKKFHNQNAQYESKKPEKKELISEAFSEIVPNSNFTRIQAIDAIANYFKHNDEWIRGWGGKWVGLKPNEINTIYIVSFLGMTRSNPNNIQLACEKLNFNKENILQETYDLLNTWSNNIKLSLQ